jgi:signal peptidase I
MKLFEEFKTKEFFKNIIFAVIFATIFRSLVYQPFEIPSASMLPNLVVGDRLLVQKFSYGYSKYSFPLNMVPFSGKILDKHKPKHGDIVVFKMPSKGNEYFIKRVIAAPGDIIEVKKGIVFVNKVQNKKILIEQGSVDIGGISAPLYIEQETNHNGYSYKTYRLSEKATLPEDNFAPVKVPEGTYFVMGDNRNNSRDSRFEDMGFIPEDQIIGKAQIIFFSAKCGLYEFWNWKNDVYISRILNRLDKSL